VIAVVLNGPRDTLNGHPDMIEGGYSAGSTVAWQQGRFRPFPELSGYRMLVDNVYNCSSNMHSGSGIGRGSSYNCWKKIEYDLAIV
jgi:phytoene dehydrogenase-like protein